MPLSTSAEEDALGGSGGGDEKEPDDAGADVVVEGGIVDGDEVVLVETSADAILVDDGGAEVAVTVTRAALDHLLNDTSFRNAVRDGDSAEFCGHIRKLLERADASTQRTRTSALLGLLANSAAEADGDFSLLCASSLPPPRASSRTMRDM
jgi:hypothetical protein